MVMLPMQCSTHYMQVIMGIAYEAVLLLVCSCHTEALVKSLFFFWEGAVLSFWDWTLTKGSEAQVPRDLPSDPSVALGPRAPLSPPSTPVREVMKGTSGKFSSSGRMSCWVAWSSHCTLEGTWVEIIPIHPLGIPSPSPASSVVKVFFFFFFN